MKNLTIFKALATIAVMLCLATFISCEKEETAQQNSPKYVKAIEYYEVTLTEDFFDFYDVVATIGNSETDVKTIKFDSRVWKYSKTWDDIIPGKFTCDVIATVKNPLPEIDPDKLYTFKVESSSLLQLYDEAGRLTLPMGGGSNGTHHGMSLKGVDKVTKYVTEKHREVVILNSSYTIK